MFHHFLFCKWSIWFWCRNEDGSGLCLFFKNNNDEQSL